MSAVSRAAGRAHRCCNGRSLSEVNGAVDELLWPNELARRGLPMHDRALTWSSWNRNVLKQVEDSTLTGLEATPSNRTRSSCGRSPSSGRAARSPSTPAHAIGWACSQALEGGFAFARKFVGMRAKAIDGLQRCQRMSHKQMAGVATLAGGRYKVPVPRRAEVARRGASWPPGRPSARRPIELHRLEAALGLVFGASNVDAYHGVFGDTRRRRRHGVLRVSGLHAVAAGLRRGRRGEGARALLGVGAPRARGPRSVTWYALRCTSPDSRPTSGGRVLRRGRWKLGARHRESGRPPLADSAKLREHASTSSRGGKAWASSGSSAQEGDSGRRTGR